MTPSRENKFGLLTLRKIQIDILTLQWSTNWGGGRE
jgi:hypothetical protein